MMVLVLVILLLLDLLLATDGQDVILDRNLDVFALEPRHLRRDHDLLVGFGHVDAGHEVHLGFARDVEPAREVFEQSIYFAMQEAERVDDRDYSSAPPTPPGGQR